MKRSAEGLSSEARRGDPGRISSRSVLRLTDGGKTTKGKEKEKLTEGEKVIQGLLHRQLDTTKEGIVKRDKKEFLTGSVYQSLSVGGSKSLEEFTELQHQQKQLQDLRKAGLTDGDIVLKLGVAAAKVLFEQVDPLRRGDVHFGRSKLGISPDVLMERKQAIEQMVGDGKTGQKSGTTSKISVAGLSSEVMDCSRGESVKLSNNSKKSKSQNWNFPKEIMPSHMEYQVDVMLRKGRMKVVDKEEEFEEETEQNDEEKCIDESKPPKLAKIEPLPVQVIERNKLTLSELKQLPKFKNYSQGTPSRVLFVKNLHPKVSEGDLFALFGKFPGNGEDPVKIQLMKGKMRGQAFVEFKSEEVAGKAMELVNGYVMRGRPVVVQYGRTRDDQSTESGSSNN